METAKKMKIFQQVQMNLASLGYRRNQSPFHKLQLWICAKAVLTVCSLCIYCVREANTNREYIVTIFMIASVLLINISRLSTLFENAAIFNLIDRIENIINGRLKYPASKKLYEKTNQRVETICVIINVISLRIFIPSVIIPKAIFCYFQYFLTDLGMDAFGLSLPMWFPLNWKNPFGYSIAVILQLVSVSVQFEYVGCFMSFAFAGLMLAFSVAKDVKHFSNEIDQDLKTKKSRSKVMAKLSEFIQFTNMRDLVNTFSEIYQITLVVLFLGCTIAMCLALLMIQLDMTHSGTDRVVLLGSLFWGFWATILVFVVCEIGQRLSNICTDLYESICQLEWYFYPVEVQQMFGMIMMYAQKPVEITFFGSYACSCEQFKKVVNKAYSFFMVLRKLFG